MIRYEATDGPYKRWLEDARKRLGERLWDLVMEREWKEAWAILQYYGVVEFEQSRYYVEWKQSMGKDSRRRGEKPLVTLVQVTYMGDSAVEEIDEEGPRDAVDPRVLDHGSALQDLG